ncbi:MAG: hypothetical protein VX278_22910 [Myxococcota bacterium]|nr:hypothetical protein [Myxococcota bacterium]
MTSYCIAYLWDGSPVPKEDQVTIELVSQDNGDLLCSIHAPFYNDPAPKKPAGSMWELWNHEVVECFFVGKNGHYLEAEFGPHGHYLILKLDAPRSIIQRELSVRYQATIEKDYWTGTVTIPSHYLPDSIERFNLFSIHGTGSQRSYQCYSALPGEKPDFHQPHRFPSYP